MKKLPCGANLKRDFLRFYKRNSFKNAMPNTQYFAILKKNALFPCETAGPKIVLETINPLKGFFRLVKKTNQPKPSPLFHWVELGLIYFNV